jgi:hypothetical protein
MKATVAIPLLVGLLFTAAVSLPAEAFVDSYRSTGLGLEGRKGYLSEQDPQDLFVVVADESPVSLLFFWDTEQLAPSLKVERQGTLVANLDLKAGEKVTLTGGGRFVCTISASKGTGHWACVVFSGKEWDR